MKKAAAVDLVSKSGRPDIIVSVIRQNGGGSWGLFLKSAGPSQH